VGQARVVTPGWKSWKLMFSDSLFCFPFDFCRHLSGSRLEGGSDGLEVRKRYLDWQLPFFGVL